MTQTKRGRRAAATGRKLHSEKITVYLDTDELTAIDIAKLQLRDHGIDVDRGRIIREGALQLIADEKRLIELFREG